MFNDENRNIANTSSFGQSRFDTIGKEVDSPMKSSPVKSSTFSKSSGSTTLGQKLDSTTHRVEQNMKGNNTFGQNVDNIGHERFHLNGRVYADSPNVSHNISQDARHAAHDVKSGFERMGEKLKDAFGMKPEPHTDHVISRLDHVDETVVQDPVYDKSQDPVGADIVPNTRPDPRAVAK
jgi:hypothetical protein